MPIRVPSRPQCRDQRGACPSHGVENGLTLFGEELDEFLRHRLGEFGGMHQHTLLARRRVVDEPGLLELQPALGIEIVQFIGWT